MHALILALALIGQGVETQPAGSYAREVARYPLGQDDALRFA